MAGIAQYSIQPDLFGTHLVSCSLHSLSGTYENEAHFLHECQKKDWPIFISACNKAVDTAHKVYLGGYFARNLEAQRLIIKTCNESIVALSTMNPIAQGEKVLYMIEMLPLFARTKNAHHYDRDINAAISTIQGYFDRYLAKYATYSNSFLTA